MLTQSLIDERREPFQITNKVIELLELLASLQTKGYATVFFEISGHINKLDIRLYTPVWDYGMTATNVYSAYMNDDFRIRFIIASIKENFDY